MPGTGRGRSGSGPGPVGRTAANRERTVKNESIVYLNGEFVPKSEATVPVEDRGFLFGDAVYEATPAYRGAPFLLDRHLARLSRSLAALRIDYDVGAMPEVHRRLIDENGLDRAPFSYVYVQVTRGVAPRGHAFPREPVPPTVYGFASPAVRPPRSRWEEGYAAITVPDRRWGRADVKVTSLVANVLAQQAATEAGVEDAIFVRDGMALEGTHNNFFAVFGGVVTTSPASNYILHGITRDFVLERAAALGVPVDERAIPVEELREADEAFFAGTTTEIRPTVELDGRPVGTGRVGPVTRRLFDDFLEMTEAGSAPRP